MKFGLAQHIIDALIAVFEQHVKVDKALVFGSRAKGNYRPDSDIDIAIKGQDITTDDIIAMGVAFEEKGITHKIDLINYHTIKEPALKDHIDRVGIEFYSWWKEVKLGDILDIKHGFAFSGKHIIEEPTNNILITPGNFNIGGGFKSSKFKYYNSDYPSDYILNSGDIVVTMTDLSQETDTLGYSAKVPAKLDINYLHNQRIGLVLFKSKEVDSDFIYWILRTREYQGFIVGSASGTSIMHTAPSRIKEYSFLLPPIQEQTAIATILSSLDDKIDLLHRQNLTLEQLAETLFRQWFVEEAEESWEVGNVLDLFKLHRGYDLPTQNRIEGKYPIVTSSGVKETHYEYKIKRPGVITGRSGLLGGVYFVDEDFWPLNTSLYVSEFKRGTPLFTYYFLKTLDLKSLNGGSAVPTLNRNNVHELITDLPPRALIEKFEELTKMYFQKIKSNQTQIRTLTKTRDSLLPKLMSGEVRVQLSALGLGGLKDNRIFGEGGKSKTTNPKINQS